jgi:hypothetical protein
MFVRYHHGRMIRRQIKLTEEQAREALKRRSLESLGRFNSGVRDLASAHDRYLDDAFAGN